MDSILEDIRVLDLTHVWFGPWCTMMLAELGAEVIKVEPPWGALDRIPERGLMYGGVSATFHHLNLNKKDVALDLKSPKGKKIFQDLVKISDVVVENFSPGTMKKLGLDYPELTKIKPEIIYASLSGFGQMGPYAPRPSYASIAEAITGFTRAQGDVVNPDGPPVSMTGAFGDLAPGTMAAMSIIAALRFRDKTGRGQMIDVAQADCMTAYNTNITTYFVSGKNEADRRKELDELQKQGASMINVGGVLKTKGWVHKCDGWKGEGNRQSEAEAGSKGLGQGTGGETRRKHDTRRGNQVLHRDRYARRTDILLQRGDKGSSPP